MSAPATDLSSQPGRLIADPGVQVAEVRHVVGDHAADLDRAHRVVVDVVGVAPRDEQPLALSREPDADDAVRDDLRLVGVQLVGQDVADVDALDGDGRVTTSVPGGSVGSMLPVRIVYGVAPSRDGHDDGREADEHQLRRGDDRQAPDQPQRGCAWPVRSRALVMAWHARLWYVVPKIVVLPVDARVVALSAEVHVVVAPR